MKRSKKPTRAQKEVISSHDLVVSEWMVINATEFYLYLIHKTTGRKKTIDNFKRRKRA